MTEEVPQKAKLTERVTDWLERTVWTERMVATLLKGGPEGGKWYSLLDKAFTEKALRAGFAKAKENDGAPGVDRITIEQFGNKLDEEIQRLLEDWKAGTYRPQPVRRTWIPKPGGSEWRPLGIPTVRDRVAQAALRTAPVDELDPAFFGLIGFRDRSVFRSPGGATRGYRFWDGARLL